MDTQPQTKKLYIFDLDGNLITSYMNNPDKAYDRWDVLPGRREKLAGLLAEGHTVAIITNQAGVAFGFITEADVVAKIKAALDKLGLPPETHVGIAYGHPSGQPPYNSRRMVSYRKPSPRMLLEMMEITGHTGDSTIYVGDRTEDRNAAQYAGVEFITTYEFFGPTPGTDDDLPF